MPLVAWLLIIGAALIVLPSFSPAQEDAAPLEATEKPVSEENPLKAAANEPEESVADSTAVLSTAAPDDAVLSQKIRELQTWMRETRGKGRSLDIRDRNRIYNVLTSLAEQMRKRGATDDSIVTEMFLQVLGRRPDTGELVSYRHMLRANDLKVNNIVDALARSTEFADGPRRTDVTATSAAVPAHTPVQLPAPLRTKKAKAQTLLRVAYDMPRDKSEALAKFLEDQVEEGHVDVRTVESGLIVTAEANIQRTIVGIVSLMIGEPVALDLGDTPPIGHGTTDVPIYIHSDGTVVRSGDLHRPDAGRPTRTPGVYASAPRATRVPSSLAPSAPTIQPATADPQPAKNP